MSDEIKRVAAQLQSLNVRFAVVHGTPSGQRELPLPAEDVAAYVADPTAVLARIYGVSKTDYLGWHASRYAVICAGKTSKGKPCKMAVTGLTLLENPKVWADHQGEYCSVHGGPAAGERVVAGRFRSGAY